MSETRKSIALVTGASSGFGRMIARDLANAGCVSYASLRDIGGKNAKIVAEHATYAKQHQVDLRSIELDVASDDSARTAKTSIVVPGAFTTGTNHFANAGKPADEACASKYEAGYRPNFYDDVKSALAATSPKDADPSAVGRAVVDIFRKPAGARPLRVCIDPADDGAALSFQVIDRIREQFLHRIGFSELLHPAQAASPT